MILYQYSSQSDKVTKAQPDSQAALQAFGKAEITSKMVKNAIEVWEEVAESGIKISVEWVKAHIGIEGNELADEEAKMGALSLSIWSETLRPWKETLKEVEKVIKQEWKIRWKNIYKHDASKIFISGPDKQKAKHLLNLCRSDLMMLTRAISGQNFLAYHQSKIDFTVKKNM